MTRRQRAHCIADISFGRMYAHCDCGRKITGSDAEDLAEQYQLHRVACGLKRVQLSKYAQDIPGETGHWS